MTEHNGNCLKPDQAVLDSEDAVAGDGVDGSLGAAVSGTAVSFLLSDPDAAGSEEFPFRT